MHRGSHAAEVVVTSEGSGGLLLSVFLRRWRAQPAAPSPQQRPGPGNGRTGRPAARLLIPRRYSPYARAVVARYPRVAAPGCAPPATTSAYFRLAGKASVVCFPVGILRVFALFVGLARFVRDCARARGFSSRERARPCPREGASRTFARPGGQGSSVIRKKCFRFSGLGVAVFRGLHDCGHWRRRLMSAVHLFGRHPPPRYFPGSFENKKSLPMRFRFSAFVWHRFVSFDESAVQAKKVRHSENDDGGGRMGRRVRVVILRMNWDRSYTITVTCLFPVLGRHTPRPSLVCWSPQAHSHPSSQENECRARREFFSSGSTSRHYVQRLKGVTNPYSRDSVVVQPQLPLIAGKSHPFITSSTQEASLNGVAFSP